jgi:hypothetical protein
MILNIDRFLVVSMEATRSVGQLLLMALPRLAMAALFSLAISTPLVLRVFSSDIKAQIYSTQLQRSEQQAARISASKESRDAAALAKQIAQDQAVLDGHLPDRVTSPALQQAQQQVISLTAQQQQAQAASDTAYEAWQCELYGAGPNCHRASTRAGPGPLAGAKQQEYIEARARLAAVTTSLQRATAAEQTAERQVETAQAGALAAAQRQARSDLPALRSRYATVQADLQKISNAGTAVNFGDTGILAQLQALTERSSRNGTVLAAHLVVMALFFLIEILPVTTKVLLNLQLPTAYEVVAQAADADVKEGVEARQVETRRIREGETRDRLAADEDRRRHELTLTKQAYQQLASEVAPILGETVREWGDHVRSARANANGNAAKSGRPSMTVRHLNGRPWLPGPDSI